MLSHQVPETARPLETADDRKTVATNRALFGDICELWALFAFAVAEPVYSRLVNRPMYLERQIDSSLWLLIGLLSFVGPVLLAAASVGLACLSRRLYRAWHAGVWFVMAGLLVLFAFRYSTLRLPFYVGAVGAIGLTTMLVVGRQRVASIGSLLRVASLGTLIFPVVFAVEVFDEGGDSRPAAAGTEIRRPTPVVLIVFDEFCGVTLMDANREVNAARFPGFAELGATATWYRNATSVHPRTDHAVPAILSGTYPNRIAQPLAREYPQNLFSLLLPGRTYSPVVFEPFTRLYPIAALTGFKSETLYHDSTSSFFETLWLAYLQELLPDDQTLMMIDLPLAWFNLRNPSEEWSRRGGLLMHLWDSDRIRQVDHFLECIVPRSQPALYFAHFCLPHYPWCYLPSGRNYEADGGIFKSTPIPGALGELHEDWGPDDLATDQACVRYILQAQFADRQIARLIARLKETGVFDECLLIVVADHGVSFRPNRSRRAPAADSLADLMSVPLFVKLPHQTAGGVSDRNVETIDILPSIAEVLAMDLPEPVDGISFLNPAAPERATKRFINTPDVIEVDAVFEEKYAVLAHLIGKFGGGRSPERMFRLGPHSELIGRPAGELRDGPHPRWKPVIDSPGEFRAEGDFVPCHLTGHVIGDGKPPPRPLALAIAVNGIIRGTTRTYTTAQFRDRWSLMLPEEAFQPGENHVEVFVIADSVLEAAPK